MNMQTMIKYIFDTKNNTKNKMKFKFNAYEIDLIIKSLWLGYSNVDNELLLFRNKENDKNKLFYLHRLLSSEANKFFYKKLNNDYFIYMSKGDFKKYKKIKHKLKKRN